jgi:predicted house-cleaning noncanonical NTP pyrophosphatase (MazG superfamily)
LDCIKKIATEKNFPIVIVGSILSHAFYMLDKAGLTVIAADEPSRSRTRQRRVFNKIVRDQIPEQISKHGERTALATISKSEARPALAVKLLEELFELLRAQTPAEVTAELADVLEVVRSLCAATGVNWEEVETFASAKRASRGSFERNVVLVETSWPTKGDGNNSKPPIHIKLSELSKIISDGHIHRIPFSVLLATGAERELTLSDGRRLTLTMDGDGIKLEEGESVGKLFRQLELDLRLHE